MQRILAVALLASLLTVPVAAAQSVEECTDYVTGPGTYTLLWGVGQATGGQLGWGVLNPVWIGVAGVIVAYATVDCLGAPGPWEGTYEQYKDGPY